MISDVIKVFKLGIALHGRLPPFLPLRVFMCKLLSSHFICNRVMDFSIFKATNNITTTPYLGGL